MPQRHINAAGLALLQKWEQGPGGGPAQHPYLCPAGYATIGYGHRIKTGEQFPGGGLSPEGAEDLLAVDVGWAERAVQNEVNVPLTDNQFSALVCLVFNIGRSGFDASTLLKDLNACDLDDVPSEFRRWNKVRGEVCTGLVNRRVAEIQLWSTA